MKELSKAPKFPFLGTLDWEPFEYMLLSIDSSTAEIALLPWFRNRRQLHLGDKVDLHLPSFFYQKNTLNQGAIISANQNNEIQGKVYHVSLVESDEATQAPSEHFKEQLSETTPLIELLTKYIKDSLLLKAGVRVYFKHLIPYFSRISNYSSTTFSKLENVFLRDIEKRIIDSESKLENIYQMAKQKITKREEIPVFIDLDELREIIESEISLSIFNVTFSKNKTASILDLSTMTQPQYGILMYINAIKILEKRLFFNYNTIVTIYSKSLT